MATSSRAFSSTLRTLPSFHPSLPSVPLTFRTVITKPFFSNKASPISTRFKKVDCRTKASSVADAALDEKIKGENVQVFDSEEELAVALAKYTADLSEKFCQERAAFTVGGSLIKSLRKLVDPPYVDSVDWGKWHVFWVDERVVPKDHPDNGAADDYETCLKQLVKSGTITQSEVSEFPKFDLMLLGMGPDGHVASLFPGHPLLKEDKQWVTFIKDSPKPPPERITFTFPVINSSANIALVVAGAGKASAVHTALGNGQGPDILPMQMVSPEGQLTLFLDKTAASKL